VAFAQHALKSCGSHPRGDHEIIIEGRAGDRKRARISFCIGLRRVQQGQIHRLTWLELKIRGFGEVKNHSAFGNLLALG
jgi:hypothetical protein